MNTAMWQHPITAQQVSRLKEFGYVEIPCIAKKLVCGDEGGFIYQEKYILNIYQYLLVGLTIAIKIHLLFTFISII